MDLKFQKPYRYFNYFLQTFNNEFMLNLNATFN